MMCVALHSQKVFVDTIYCHGSKLNVVEDFVVGTLKYKQVSLRLLLYELNEDNQFNRKASLAS